MTTFSTDSYIFVLAGGSGERFWPLSRKKKPKQLLRLFSDNTLLGDTLSRVKGLAPASQVLVLTNQEQKEITLGCLVNFPEHLIITEPAKRDTAPAAALATAIAYSRNPDAIVVLLPSDQLVKNVEAFRRNLQDSVKMAATTGSIITLAIPPTYPATGFGYLELTEAWPTTECSTHFQRVSRFVEKPNVEQAREYVSSGLFSWNAGMFIWKASTFLQEARRLCPDLAAFVEEFPKESAEEYINSRFPLLPKISIDYALMEKASSVLAAKTEFDWDDVGCWTSLSDHLPGDSTANVLSPHCSVLESSNNIVYSPKKHVALCGVSDLVVVETEDALLICHRDKVQDIKKILPSLPPELL
jgi:mannose-1-phosphate guanylyltransferase